MTLVRWSPMQQLASMEVERLNRMFDHVRRNAFSGAWVPAVDIYEDAAHRVVIRAELPEMKREDIKVTVENDTLSLSGERKAPEIREGAFQRQERQHGEFSRSFTLPATLDASQISATYQDGVLTITVPPREEAKPKQIQIEAN